MIKATKEEISSATAYENLFIPALFGQWTKLILDSVNVSPGDNVLDVACGTGILAKETLKRVLPGGTVTGLDPAPGMLSVAENSEPAVKWIQGVAEELPFDDGTFDKVLSQFGLMFFKNRERSVQEILRVLKTGGIFAVAVWDNIENNSAYSDLVKLFEAKAGRESADASRFPFSLGNNAELEKLFYNNNIKDLRINTISGKANFPDIRIMVEAELRGWLPLMGVYLDEEKISQILSDAENILGKFKDPNGNMKFDISAHIVSGSKIG